MRPVRDISDQENFRVEQQGRAGVIRRDPVRPEPIGTIVLMAFRVVGYDQDCDGSLMARLENISMAGQTTGWQVDSIGLHPDCELVVTEEELSGLFENDPPLSPPVDVKSWQ